MKILAPALVDHHRETEESRVEPVASLQVLDVEEGDELPDGGNRCVASGHVGAPVVAGAYPPTVGSPGHILDPMEHPSVAILGAGAMGEVLAGGLLRAGWLPSDLTLVARREERRIEVESATGVNASLDPAEAVDRQGRASSSR